MNRLRVRLAIYIGSLVALTAAYTVAYRWGMATLEGEPRTWFGALEVVVQSMTTTGYGQDAPWSTREMTALMVLIQLTGIGYIFVAFPLFVVPWLERLVQQTPPERVEGASDHVVVAGYTDLTASLIDDLASNETPPYVVLEGDEERARELHVDGIEVVHGDPATEAGLDGARVGAASAIVVDATEREFITTVVAIREREPDATILALVGDPTRARYLRYADVDDVLSPKHRLGKTLGDKVRDVVSISFEEEFELGADLHVVEHPVGEGSDLYGRPLAAAHRVERTGATVLGAWVSGDFVTTLPPEVTADEHTTLVVAGTDAELDAVADLVGTRGHRYQPDPEPIVVAGAGIVGASVLGGLERAGLETVHVAREVGEFVDSPPDVVGDVTDETTLAEAGIDEARTLVLALEDDVDALLATLAARERNPDLEILVAASADSSVSRLRTAGANYVLSLPSVAGRMVLLDLFEGDTMTLADRLHLVRESARGLAGEELRSAELRSDTGCAVVALERDGELVVDAEGRTLEADDRLVLAGTERDLERFREAFGG